MCCTLPNKGRHSFMSSFDLPTGANRRLLQITMHVYPNYTSRKQLNDHQVRTETYYESGLYYTYLTFLQLLVLTRRKE